MALGAYDGNGLEVNVMVHDEVKVEAEVSRDVE